MESSLSCIHYYLVTHPKILTFSWNPGQTIASTPNFVVLAVLIYLCLTFLLPRFPLPSPSPRILKSITALHSLTLFLLSAAMVLGCLLSIFHHKSSLFSQTICFPLGTAPTGPLFFWAYVFYLSKLLEFGDTVLIILSNSLNRLTFLHVYHHATVLVMSYLWLQTSQSLFPVALITNALVHVIMYYYYFCCAIGIRPKWKKLVTNVQIVQFLFSFVVSCWMLQEHVFGSGCSGFSGWCFNAVFNASLLVLFVNFHLKSYNRSKSEEAKHKKI